jgi:hypothetical protein
VLAKLRGYSRDKCPIMSSRPSERSGKQQHRWVASPQASTEGLFQQTQAISVRALTQDFRLTASCASFSAPAIQSSGLDGTKRT